MPPKSGKGKGVKGGKKKLAAKRPREEDQQAEEEPHHQQEVEVEAPAAEAEADDLVVFDPTEEATADVEGDEAEAEAEAGEEDEGTEGTQGTKRPKATVLERCLAGQRNKIASHSVLVHRVPRSVTQAALQAALEELLGKEEVHSVHHKPSPAAAPTATSNVVVVLRSAEGVIGALQRGKVTVDGQDFVLEPGVSTLARGVYLYGIGESVTDLEVTRLLEERVQEPGAVELVIRRKPFLPVRGGFALFRTVQLAVAASHPHKVVRAAAPESSESSEPSGVFRVSLDSIKTHNCAVFVTARPGVTELGEATVAGEVDRVFGDGSFVDMLLVAPPPKPKALVVLRVSGTIPQAIERLNKSDVKAFVTYANITGRDWATQLRIQHFPADHAPPLGDILRFYESHLPSEFTMLTGVSSVRGNTLVSFGTPGMAVRAFFLGPVVLSSGAELPVFLSQPKEANKGYHHSNKNEDGRPAKQQRHDTNGGRGGGGRGGGRGRGPTSRGGPGRTTWRGGRGGRSSA